MSILPAFLRSLLLTIIFSLAAPTLLAGLILASLKLLSYVPGLSTMSQFGLTQVLQFLATFGNGHSWQGLLIISMTCGLVGALFDTFTFYRYQRFRND